MLLIAAAAMAQAVSGGATAGYALVVLQARGLTAGEVQVAEVLLRGHLDSAGIGGMYSLPDSHVALEGIDDTDAAVGIACQRLGCARAILAEIERVDADAMLVAVSVTSPDGRVERRLEAIAADLDDLHPVFERLARAVVSNAPLGSIAARVAPPRPSTPPPDRVERYRGFKIGAWGPAALEWGMDLSVAYNQRWQRADQLLEWSLGLTVPIPGDPSVFAMVYSDVGMAHLFGQGDLAPYLGGGGGVRIGGYDTVGLGVGAYGLVGFEVDRDAPTTLYVQARAGLDAFTGGGIQGVYPALVLGAETGVGF